MPGSTVVLRERALARLQWQYLVLGTAVRAAAGGAQHRRGAPRRRADPRAGRDGAAHLGPRPASRLADRRADPGPGEVRVLAESLQQMVERLRAAADAERAALQTQFRVHLRWHERRCGDHRRTRRHRVGQSIGRAVCWADSRRGTAGARRACVAGRGRWPPAPQPPASRWPSSACATRMVATLRIEWTRDEFLSEGRRLYLHRLRDISEREATRGCAARGPCTARCGAVGGTRPVVRRRRAGTLSRRQPAGPSVAERAVAAGAGATVRGGAARAAGRQDHAGAAARPRGSMRPADRVPPRHPGRRRSRLRSPGDADAERPVAVPDARHHRAQACRGADPRGAAREGSAAQGDLPPRQEQPAGGRQPAQPAGPPLHRRDGAPADGRECPAREVDGAGARAALPARRPVIDRLRRLPRPAGRTPERCLRHGGAARGVARRGRAGGARHRGRGAARADHHRAGVQQLQARLRRSACRHGAAAAARAARWARRTRGQRRRRRPAGRLLARGLRFAGHAARGVADRTGGWPARIRRQRRRRRPRRALCGQLRAGTGAAGDRDRRLPLDVSPEHRPRGWRAAPQPHCPT